MFDFERIHRAISELREQQLFFICGMPKSGTTWMQLLLDAHPEVSCSGEGHFLDRLAPALREALERHAKLLDRQYTSAFQELSEFPKLDEEHVLYLVGTAVALFLLVQRGRKAARVIGEKTPDNVAHLSTLDLLFPNAKFILVVRDGRDCAVSGWFDNLRVGGDGVLKAFGSIDVYAREIAGVWADTVEKSREFATRHPNRARLVRYEDLVADTAAVLADLCRLLTVDARDSVVARCRDAAAFVKLSGGRSPGEENRNTFFRKGVPGDWRNHLSAEGIASFQDRAGESLARLGYE